MSSPVPADDAATGSFPSAPPTRSKPGRERHLDDRGAAVEPPRRLHRSPSGPGDGGSPGWRHPARRGCPPRRRPSAPRRSPSRARRRHRRSPWRPRRGRGPSELVGSRDDAHLDMLACREVPLPALDTVDPPCPPPPPTGRSSSCPTAGRCRSCAKTTAPSRASAGPAGSCRASVPSRRRATSRGWPRRCPTATAKPPARAWWRPTASASACSTSTRRPTGWPTTWSATRCSGSPTTGCGTSAGSRPSTRRGQTRGTPTAR